MSFVQILLFLLPLRSVSLVRADARRELKLLSKRGSCFSQRPIVVRYDTRYSFPGLGDLFLLIMLANYLSALGNPCVFSTNLDTKSPSGAMGPKETQYSGLINRFLSSSVLLRSEASVAVGIGHHILLSNRVVQGRDVSAVAIQIVGRLFQSRRLNPRRITPDLSMVIDPEHETTQVENRFSEVTGIGYHVRFSKHDLDRNPNLNLAAEDCLALMKIFPQSQIVWFGEREQFDNVREKLQQDSEFVSRVTYQASESFEEAVVEAHNLDFWFQRFGGGIGAPLIFGTKPYLVLSGDPVATRYYFYKKGRIVPWATKHQRWLLLLVDRGRPLGKILRSQRSSRIK